jgi:hypothetical protein
MLDALGCAAAVSVAAGPPVVGAEPGDEATAVVDADAFADASADVDVPESQAESPRVATRAVAARAAVRRA